MVTRKNKNKVKNKKFTLKKDVCSTPKRDFKYTCYSGNSLEKMKRFWNTRHPNNQIDSNEPSEIWNHLKLKMKTKCNKESCWLKQQFIKNHLDKQLSKYTFAPTKPKHWIKKPRTWLTSLDIENVMEQYKEAYRDFTFYGPSPIDFNTKKLYGQCVWNEICKFNLKKEISKNITKIGFIFNTDPHYLPGEHWVSMFVSVKKQFIYYFDSTGEKTPIEIISLIKKIKQQGKQIGLNFKVKINKFPHQQKDTECGIYSLFFISYMLIYENINFFDNKRISDDTIFQFRNVFFNS